MTKSTIGYHINTIPKGVVGEPSKIVEEAMEIADAHLQGVKIMAATELADLYGAMVSYMEKHHPELTMADVHDMHIVTRRAFESGRRT
jgi:phosphoribosyl-ATP pyrophosphohydrolase